MFDLLAVEGFDLRDLPVDRPQGGAPVHPARGRRPPVPRALREATARRCTHNVQRMGLEGIVAKRADSPYRMRRSADWIKVRADTVDDFVVVGASRPKGTRTGFGALHLAQYVDGELVYMGRAGSGFSDKQLDERHEGARVAAPQDAALRRARCRRARTRLWVEPELVAEVRFKERTDDGLAPPAGFPRFRDDKGPEECIYEVR